MSRTYVAIVKDHSGSMFSLTKGAIKDFNTNLEQLKSVNTPDNEVFLSIVDFSSVANLAAGVTPIEFMKPINSYAAGGSTALWDAVGLAASHLSSIESLNSLERSAANGTTIPPESNDAFLVMVITDGEENASRKYSVNKIMEVIRSLQNTDKWTFVFRVPVGYGKRLASMGIYPGNIIEWDQTEVALARSTQQTEVGIQNYFQERKLGKTSTKSFYANLDHLAKDDLDMNMDDVTNQVKVLDVGSDSIIKDFCMKNIGQFQKGHAYYQLTKSETVQDYKEMAIRDTSSGKIYKGIAARTMLGFPPIGSVKVRPGNHGNFELFVQSTSVNRKLVGGTRVLYIN